MTEQPQSKSKTRWVAWVVLALSLAATVFAWWREHELARSNQIIHWQDALSQVQPTLTPMLGRRFDGFFDNMKVTLRRDGGSEKSWDEFLQLTEWRQRYSGMKEMGYAELEGTNCTVRFLETRTPSARQNHPVGFDLMTDPVIREAINKSIDKGYGIASREINFREGTNTSRVTIGLVPVTRHDQKPGTPEENRAILIGYVFYALDHTEYFKACQAQLPASSLDLRLLTQDEPAPLRTSTQRVITITVASGEWRLFFRMQNPATGVATAELSVLSGGIVLSVVLFVLFGAQARLRHEAETSREIVLQRDAEIIALNRDLESRISQRTSELKEALSEEKELNRLKSNFISMVTHEIRTPLALILGSSEILSRYLDRLTEEKRKQHLETIGSSVGRMSALLEDVLLFSKAEAGRMEFNPVLMDLKVFCSTLVDELESATHRRCPIELSIEVNEPARSDESILRHIFANLVSNAVKYSPAGVAVKFSVVREGGDAVFTVKDSGMGILEEDRQRIFTPFYRGKNAATIPGTGLGLVIVQHCVDRHGGKIDVESAENAGTKVTVRLPLFSPAHTEFIKRLSNDSNP